MSKQYAAFHVSWRHSKRRPIGLLADEASYARAAAQALEEKLNELAAEGWIIDRIIPAAGFTPQQSAGFTVIAFR